MSDFRMTHVVPGGGLDARASADPNLPVIAQLHPSTQLQLVQRYGDWAEVRADNGWTGWVDGRYLVDGAMAAATVAPPATAAPATRGTTDATKPDPIALGGGALVAISAFLPWMSVLSVGVDGFDVPLMYVLTGDEGDGLKIGLVMLVAGVLAAAPLVLGEQGRLVTLATAVVGVGLGGEAVIRAMRTDFVDPGVGAFAALLGGGLVYAAHVRARMAQ